MKRIIIHYSQFVAICFIAVACAKNAPVSVCSSNPHYFEYKGKPVLLITSDHHYGAVIDIDFNYEKYLTYLAENGSNLTRIYPGGMFESPDKYIRGNPLGPLPGRQLLPWAKSDQPGANALLADSGNVSFKYDLNKWNSEYFKRLKAFVAYAREKDIIVEVAFFNGMYAVCWPLMAMYHENNIQKVGNYEATECGLFTTDNVRNQDVIKFQKAYVQKITTELNEYENVIFDISDEPSLQGLPDGSCITMPDSVIVPWIQKMKEAFLETEKTLPVKHLLGQTVQSLSPDFSNETWCNWLPAEYIKNGEKALNINFKNNKPLVNVESNYFGTSLTKSQYTADAVRLEGWWFMLRGGAGCINLNGEFSRGQETGGSITQNQIIPQKKVLKGFLERFDFVKMSPFNNISDTPSNAFCYALAESGKQYALYIFHGAYESEWGSHFIPQPGNYTDTIKLNDIPAGNYVKQWIEPVTGKTLQTENIDWKGGNLLLVTPAYSLDLVLSLKANSY